jgi:hypothetical protein
MRVIGHDQDKTFGRDWLVCLPPENAHDGVAKAPKQPVRCASDDLFERGLVQSAELGRSVVSLFEVLGINRAAFDGP